MAHTRTRARWQEHVLSKTRSITYEGDRLATRADDGRPSDSVLTAVGEHLEEAAKAAQVPQGRTARMSGAAIEAAYINLHAAQVALVDLYDEPELDARVPGVLARLEGCLPPADDRRQHAETMFGHARTRGRADAQRPFPTRRTAFRAAMKASYEAADARYAQVRSFRNLLAVTTLLLVVLVGAVCLVGISWPQTVPLCFESTTGTGAAVANTWACPSSTGLSQPGYRDVPIVALMGLLGGALSATFTIQRLRGTSTPYGVPVALSVLKLPAGALTAIVGLVLVHGEFVPGLTALDSQGQILAYAIMLGFAQQIATGFIDRRAEDVLNSVPGRDPARSSRQPTATARVLVSGGSDGPQPAGAAASAGQ